VPYDPAMLTRAAGFSLAAALLAGSVACSGSSATSPPTTAPGAPTTPTVPTTPQASISAPIPVSPGNGAATSGWPTFIVTDATRTGAVSNALVYRFDISTSSTFGSILVTGTVSEAPSQTSFTPPASTPAPAQSVLYWRVVAIDPINVIASPATTAQSFTYTAPPSAAAVMATQEGTVLWPGTQPPGAPGHATLGNFWSIATLVSYNGVSFLSPPLEALQVFDLLDRGMDPQSAIDWMHANGYATIAAWYPSVAVIGFNYEYMAFINGRWDLVLKTGA